MLRWCAYCQQFQGESPPFENLIISHGICPDCKTKGLDLTESEIEQGKKLKVIQLQLMTAGKNGDLGLAEQFVENALNFQIRPIDILMGIVTPFLFQVGQDWQRGALSAAEQQSCSSFCESVFALVSAKVKVQTSVDEKNKTGGILLINAPGNTHNLAIRILALWLQSQKIEALTIYPCPEKEDLGTLIKEIQPKIILISMALAEHRSNVIEIVEYISSLQSLAQPKILLGGNAVKLGLVPGIPNVELVTDIASLKTLL